MGLSHSAVAVGPWWPYTRSMRPLSYAGYRFPPEIIRHAIWLYARSTLSFRDVEELLAERGIALAAMSVTREGYTLRTKRDASRPILLSCLTCCQRNRARPKPTPPHLLVHVLEVSLV